MVQIFLFLPTTSDQKRPTLTTTAWPLDWENLWCLKFCSALHSNPIIKVERKSVLTCCLQRFTSTAGGWGQCRMLIVWHSQAYEPHVPNGISYYDFCLFAVTYECVCHNNDCASGSVRKLEGLKEHSICKWSFHSALLDAFVISHLRHHCDDGWPRCIRQEVK